MKRPDAMRYATILVLLLHNIHRTGDSKLSTEQKQAVLTVPCSA